MSKKCYVLSSGGLDSTTCLAMAVNQYGKENVTALNIFYGQRNFAEMKSQRAICDHYGVKRLEIDLNECFRNNKSSLIRDGKQELQLSSYEEQLKENGVLTTNVPFRNGLFVSAAACIAAGQTDDEIVIYLGAQKSDGIDDGYPDCSEEFIKAMNKSLMRGTKGQVHLETPILSMSKEDVAYEAIKLSVPIELTWSCYQSQNEPCGVCASCRLRESAIKKAEERIRKEKLSTKD